jgi:hypothetical protein
MCGHRYQSDGGWTDYNKILCKISTRNLVSRLESRRCIIIANRRRRKFLHHYLSTPKPFFWLWWNSMPYRKLSSWLDSEPRDQHTNTFTVVLLGIVAENVSARGHDAGWSAAVASPPPAPAATHWGRVGGWCLRLTTCSLSAVCRVTILNDGCVSSPQ